MGEKEAYMIANQNFRLYDEANDKLLTWHEIVKSKEKIKDLANAIKRIAELNSSDETFRKIGSLVDVVGLTGFLNEENLHTIYSIIEKLSEVDLSKLDYDALGHAYQWILRYFAPQKAKEGEVYTPHEVIKLIIRLIDPEERSTIADPAAGSGAMLIEAYRYVKTKTGKDSVTLKLLGKERNETTAALAVMNMVIHGIKDYKIYIGDSLINPKLNGEADYVVANPPWNQDGYGEEKLNTPDLRKVYKYGFPPGNTADWAWIQLMIHLAKKKVGVVIDQGALFREGKELNIRKGIVEEDLIEAVILLPEKLFYNTQAAGIVIILNKQKPPERKGKILFINATNEYEKHPEVKKLNRLTDKGIEKIVDAYRKFEDIAGFARVVTIEEIKKNNYNLNVPLYVTPLEEKQDIDLEKEWAQLQELRAKETELWAKVERFISEAMRL
ncbi:MAG: N-6 DNA methylase [Infirmifilum sp.]